MKAAIRHALRAGFTVDEIFGLTKIDRWFLVQIKEIVDFEEVGGGEELNSPEASKLLRLFDDNGKFSFGSFGQVCCRNRIIDLKRLGGIIRIECCTKRCDSHYVAMFCFSDLSVNVVAICSAN